MDYLLFILFLTFGSISSQSFCTIKGCCRGRDDACTMPRDTGVCYCDQFCTEDRHKLKSNDCCPDYSDTCNPSWVPAHNYTCYDRVEGKYYKQGDAFLMDCHECTCQQNGRNMHIMCDREECVLEKNVINDVNKERRGWVASRQEYFTGVKLSAAFGQSLGTRNFRRQVEKMHGKNVLIQNNIPESFDAREQWPDLIGGPEDQGKCGASWAFSTASVASDRWSIASKGKFNDRLSVRQLFICNKANFKCGGGYVTRAWKFVKNYGLLPQNCLTWDSIHGRTCPSTLKSSRKTKENYCPDKGTNDKVRRMSPPYRIEGEKQIMDEILKNGPVQATMTVYRDLFVYKSGIYSCPNSSKRNQKPGFHSVKIIGWGQEPNGDKYWICVNWWGNTWGENGLFRILRGRDECKIESFIVGAYAQGESGKLSPDFQRRR